MLKNVFCRTLGSSQLISNSVKLSTTCKNCPNEVLLKSEVQHSSISQNPKKEITTASCLMRRSDRLGEKSSRRLDGHGGADGAEGEHSVNIEHLNRYERLFPDENTPDLLFDGIKYADLHSVLAVCTKNNVKFRVRNPKGEVVLRHSCTKEGFKNAQKSTSIAAQTTGISLGKKLLDIAVRNVKVQLNGFGFGRISAIKGLTLGGVNVVSISDVTVLNYNTANPRPKKRRRV